MHPALEMEPRIEENAQVRRFSLLLFFDEESQRTSAHCSEAPRSLAKAIFSVTANQHLILIQCAEELAKATLVVVKIFRGLPTQGEAIV